jgi:hypothetical protein
MEHALVLRGKCVRANMRWNLRQTVPARAGDPTADISFLACRSALFFATSGSCGNGEEMKEKVVVLRELDRAIIYNEWSF